MQTMRLPSLKYPAAFFALAALILLPSYFVFANADEDKEKCHHRNDGNRPGFAVEIVSVSVSDDGSGTIEATLTRVPEALTQEHGVDDGTEITISVTEETVYKFNGEEGSADDLATGEEVFVRGDVNLDELTIAAELIADRPPEPLFHVGEVVEVDTDANTILVKAMRPKDGGDGEEQYVFITYSSDTVIDEDGEEVDESAIEVGDKIHAEGDVNKDSDEYFAEIDADRIHVFEEQTPREVKREHRQENSQSDIRE